MKDLEWPQSFRGRPQRVSRSLKLASENLEAVKADLKNLEAVKVDLNEIRGRRPTSNNLNTVEANLNINLMYVIS